MLVAINRTEKNKIEDREKLKRFNATFHNADLSLADIILVKSPKGTGKTEWLKQVVNEAKKNRQPVLLIGHRQALIISTARRLGLTPYIVIHDDPQSDRSRVSANPITDHYAICLDSLETRLTPQKHQFPIVIIDEVEQVLAHLTSDTIRPRRRTSLMFLRHYLQKAEKVYVLDADLNRVTGTAIPTLIGPTGARNACCWLMTGSRLVERHICTGATIICCKFSGSTLRLATDVSSARTPRSS